MTTDYDQISEQYKRSKLQPWRTYIESYSLLELVGDLAGKRVIDIACGEGFYTRILKLLGAANVVGVDLSRGMIDLAQRQEMEKPLGIEYIVGDGRELAIDPLCDIAVAAYLLNYAHDANELQAMCDGVARCLKPGGRFVTVNSSPALNFCTAPSYRKYGFETIARQPWQAGTPITWRFHLDDGPFDIENYYLDIPTHEAAFRRAGFREIRWHVPRLSPEANACDVKIGPETASAKTSSDPWKTFLDHPPIMLIECVK